MRGLLGRRTMRRALVVGAALLAFWGTDESSVLAQSKKTKTLSVFKGRATVPVPKTTKKLTKLYSNLLLAQPTDTTKKFALYISKDSLGSDEVKMKNKALGESIKTRLEGDGYTVLSFKTQGLTHTATFEGFTEVPWQSVGTAPVRGIAKFTRTADKQLIGTLLLCDPPAWDSADVAGYKSAVLKTKVSKR
jgi:hypothetical protein